MLFLHNRYTLCMCTFKHRSPRPLKLSSHSDYPKHCILVFSLSAVDRPPKNDLEKKKEEIFECL